MERCVEVWKGPISVRIGKHVDLEEDAVAFRRRQEVDVVRVVDVGWSVDPNAADPVLVQTDRSALLIVNAWVDEP